ncbi:ras-like GTP-binding protein RhoL [Lycorma delicatula]|uniref:ras-like GTP-binding protein RhoL n=1 Tax=Lycorma delicatula TaxID=130591 RepID=UPI003F510160
MSYYKENEGGNGVVKKLTNSPDKTKKALKVTTVGDGMVGKTCLLITYTSKHFPQEYVPTVFDNYPGIITVDDIEYNITIWDTAGQEDYERLRPLSYPNTNCFLLCFSVDNRSSYENVTTKWYPELKHHCPHTPIILVATKTDLRCASDSPMVTYSEGKKLQRKIKAVKYMECSALENNGLTEIFTESVRASIKKHPSKTRNCNVF